MNTKLPVSIMLSQKLQDITVTYHVYHEYLVKKRATDEQYQVPDIFVLTSAFAEVFPDLQVVLGGCGFVHRSDTLTTTKRFVLCDHVWLVYDESYIIDLVPYDGVFGVSVPQIIIPDPQCQRFFPNNRTFPESWGKQQKIDFEKCLFYHVEILQDVMTGIPI